MKYFVALFLLLMLFSGCDWKIGIDKPDKLSVELRVEGTTTRANISYMLNAVSYAVPNCSLPLSVIDNTMLHGGSFLLSAQGLDAVGNLTVTVLADGAPVNTQTTSEAFGFVAIYGVLP